MKNISNQEMENYIKDIKKKGCNLENIKYCFYIDNEKLNFRELSNKDFYSDIKKYDNLIFLETIIKKYLCNEYTLHKVVPLCCDLINYMIDNYNKGKELYDSKINNFIELMKSLKGRELSISEMNENIIKFYKQYLRTFEGNIKKVSEDMSHTLKVHTYVFGKNSEISIDISFYIINEVSVEDDYKIKIIEIKI
ncbi:hypothetical protein Q3304_09090 [Clostridioides sp. GD02377]|uniref:hypothetical protein n=1 Tax=unclassified Clostridioides TaxID=2635829 RepID=UPI0038A7EEEA